MSIAARASYVMKSANKRPTRSSSQAASGGARVLALRALRAWADGASHTVAEAIDALRASGPDAALARELALGAMAQRRLYDHLSDRFLKPGRQSDTLRDCLRIMAHQLFALDRIPPHAAVGECVQALRVMGEPMLTGVANAVGRKLAALRQAERHGDGPLGRLAPADIPTSVGVRYSLPDDLVNDLRSVLPHEDSEACFAALNHLPPLCTRTRPGCAPLPGHPLRTEGEWSWWEDPAEALALVGDGRCTVQDRAQGEVAEICRVRPGERVLDLCAAPGGKARALLDLHADVTLADASLSKVQELAKDGDFNRRVVVQDGFRPAFAPGSFDCVVVDAPCSNSGVLARRPEARWRYDHAHLTALQKIQTRLIRSAADLVAADGRLVYATCSLSPRENQAITHRLDGWRILAERVSWPDAWQLGGYACLLVRSTAS